MRKHLFLALGVAMDGLTAATLGVVAFAAATAVLGVACAYAYRQELRAACRLVLGQSSLSPGGNRNAAGAPSDDAEITSDGKEVAKMMLRDRDLDEVERLRTTYKRASHPEGRLFEHFVNKAYSYRLDKSGDRDKAQEFYDVVESNDKDSVRESVEFAFLVDEVEKESKHDG